MFAGSWGIHKMLPLDELLDASFGWLHNDGALSLEVLVAPSQAAVRMRALCMLSALEHAE